MAEELVRSETPSEYFRELVESALQHQHLAAQDLTAFYLVNLLTGFMHVDRAPGSIPKAFHFGQALRPWALHRTGLVQSVFR